MTDSELVNLYTELIPYVVKTYCKKNKCTYQIYDFEDIVSELFLICQQPRFEKYNFKSDRLLIFADVYLQIPKVLKKLFSSNSINVVENEDDYFVIKPMLNTEFDNNILQLYFVENYTVAEISRDLNISKDKVYRILRVFSRKLEKELHGYTN